MVESPEPSYVCFYCKAPIVQGERCGSCGRGWLVTEPPNPVDQSDAVALVAFLRSCLDEDERLARGAEGRWTAVSGEYGPEVTVNDETAWQREVSVPVWRCDDEADGCPDAARGWMAEANHIALHDPARVLADIESKRRILERWDAAYSMSLEGWPAGCVDSRVPDDVAADEAAFSALTEVVKDLAAPYRDRLGWRESWEPT